MSAWARAVALGLLPTAIALAFAALPAAADQRALPVPRAAIYPGDAITADLISEATFELKPNARLGVFDQPSEVIGKVARRTLLPGLPISITSVRLPDLVRQGRPVSAIYQADGLTISMQVIPLQAGAAGDFISIQNADSGVVIKGTVLPDGTIRVGDP